MSNTLLRRTAIASIPPALFLILVFLVSGCSKSSTESAAFQVPVEYHTLDNGLRVVLSPDHTAPTVVVAVYYNIGFRNEPRDRTGFAHLFEHMMFQGSANLGKMEFVRLIQNNGGVLNGSTRFDFTNYFEIVPAHKLETMLWAESDRMRGLAINEDNLTNQKGVVTNEVKVNVLNVPYGGFPWLDMPQYANENWNNAHNFYGDLDDLQAASLDDVKSFFDTYYTPNNAALVLVGDFDSEKALAWVNQYFGDIPSRDLPPAPDLTEPRQMEEKSFSKEDRLAQRPALAFAYHMPERNTPEYFAMGLIDQLLVQGEDSDLHRMLVNERGMTSGITGGINPLLGNMFNYNGPMLFVGSLFHDDAVSPDSIMTVVDEAIDRLKGQPIDDETLNRAMIKMRSNLYSNVGAAFGFGRADLLASYALFDDDPEKINQIEESLRKVTPELIQATAREYLRKTNRTVLTVVPTGTAVAKPVG